jgi:hypothetical protein
MRFGLGKLLTCALLATYASISLLGEGLHELVPHNHHHAHHVVQCVAADEYGHCGCCHHDEHKKAQERTVTSGGCVSDSHSCEICEFLFQAVSEPPSIVATPDFHPVVVDLPCITHSLHTATVVGLHAARGPPQLG